MPVDIPATLTLPSVTRTGDEHRDQVVIAGSHGAVYAGYVAAKIGMRAVILNDAGIGMDAAGIAALPYLDVLGLPAATVGHDTARIGDGEDMAARGVISHVNAAAAALGAAVGEPCAAGAERLRAAHPFTGTPPTYREARHLIAAKPDQPEVWALDSVALVEAGDAGRIVITGSHGGLLAGRPETAIKVAALAAVYNDAGGGIDDAGMSRLPALDERGIAAATVGAATARIGDGRSTYDDGRISHVNEAAARCGARPGMSVPDLVRLIIESQ